MKTKGFTLIEMIIAMSLMGLLLVGGGKLYHHLQEVFLTYQSEQEHSLHCLQGRQLFQQDLLESMSIQDITDSSVCLRKHAFEPPVCYVWKDSFWMRERMGGRDTLLGGKEMINSLYLLYNHDEVKTKQ